MTPIWHRPEWLAPYADVLERAIGGNLRVCFAAPPQHGKTELTMRAFLYWARFWPGLSHAYVTYSQQQARAVSVQFRELAREYGFIVGGTLDLIVLDGATRIRFTSPDGGLTGYAITGVCVLDDLIKNHKEANSPLVRENAKRFYESVARSRRHEGTSFLVMATRWHLDDPSGHLIKNEGFQYINLKAISEPANDKDLGPDGRLISDPLHRLPGEALWPSAKPVAFFAEERRNTANWYAQYQGEPRSPEARIFHEPMRYQRTNPLDASSPYALPSEGRWAFGIDLAATDKTSADWSVIIEGFVTIEMVDGLDKQGKPAKVPFRRFYIVDIERAQCEATGFLLTLKRFYRRRVAQMRWYAYGMEKAVGQFIKQHIPKLEIISLGVDKRVRATPVSLAWNEGRVLLPPSDENEPAWLQTFIDEVLDFTGQPGRTDDQVDALAAWHDLLAVGKTGSPRGVITGFAATCVF